MPRLNINYSQTIIYKIVCSDLDIENCYVGSTTHFSKRKNKHKSVCCSPDNRDHNLKLYKFIRDNGGWENWKMIEIEKYPCSDGNESRAREHYWFELLKADLNSQSPDASGINTIQVQQTVTNILNVNVINVNNVTNNINVLLKSIIDNNLDQEFILTSGKELCNLYNEQNEDNTITPIKLGISLSQLNIDGISLYHTKKGQMRKLNVEKLKILFN